MQNEEAEDGERVDIIDADKGTALVALAGDAAAVLYVGDDVGDLPAYDALDHLAARTPPVAVLGAVVGGPELPAALEARAGLLLPEQGAVLDLLDALAV